MHGTQNIKGNARATTVNALILLTLARAVSSSIGMTFLSLYADSLGYSLADIGFFSTFGSGVSILTLPFVGLIADVVGRKPVALLSGFLMGLSPIAPILSPNYLGFMAAYALLHTSFMTWQPARGAMIADAVSEEQLGFTYAKVSMAYAGTRTVIPLIAGFGILEFGYVNVFLSASMITLAVTVVFAFIAEETIGKKVSSNSIVREFLYSLKPSRGELRVHTVLVLDRVGKRVWLPLLSPYLKSVFGLDEGGVGTLTTLRSIVQLVLLTPSGRLVDRYGGDVMMGFSQLLTLLSALTLVIPGSLVFPVLAMGLLGASIAVMLPSYNVLVAVTVRNSDERGRAYSRVNITRQSLAMPMPWIGGLLSNLLISLPLLTSSIILGVNGLLVLKLLKTSYLKREVKTSITLQED